MKWFKKNEKNERPNINLAAADSIRLPAVERTLSQYGDDRNNYTLYEYLYMNYVDVAAAIDTIAAYAVGGGYEVAGDISDAARAEVEVWLKNNRATGLLLSIVKTMLIYGDAYALVAAGDEGPTVQMLNPKKVYIKINEYGEIEGYIYSPTGAIWYDGATGSDFVELPPESVMHFSYNPIGASVYGNSLLRAIKDLLDTKINLEKIAATMAWRMTHPLIHAKVGDEQNPPTIQDIMTVQGLLKNRVREDGSIANNITTSYTVDINVIPSSPDLNGLTAVLQHIQAQVDKALKVPKILMGQPEGSNRATSYNQLKGFIIFLSHIREIILDEINAKLMPELAPGAELTLNEVLKEDTMAWADIAVKLFHEGIITVDEAREMVDLPPTPEE